MRRLDLGDQDSWLTCSCLEVLKRLLWLDLEVDIMALCPFLLEKTHFVVYVETLVGVG